jgi:hypothetical protein
LIITGVVIISIPFNSVACSAVVQLPTASQPLNRVREVNEKLRLMLMTTKRKLGPQKGTKAQNIFLSFLCVLWLAFLFHR